MLNFGKKQIKLVKSIDEVDERLQQMRLDSNFDTQEYKDLLNKKNELMKESSILCSKMVK